MRWGVNFLGRKSFRECPIRQNMRRFRPEGLAARRAHCGGYPWNGYPKCAQRRGRPSGRKPLRGRVLFGSTGIGASPTPCQKPKMPAATRILTYWTLSSSSPAASRVSNQS